MAKDVIDFSDVPEEGGGGRADRVPAGDYVVKIIEVEKRWKDNDKSNVPFYQWGLQIVKGEYKGKKLRFTTSLKREALFNLRNLILAATGKNVAGKKLGFDPQKLIGKVVAVSVEDDERTDRKDPSKTRVFSSVVDVRSKDQPTEVEEEEETEDEEEESSDSDNEEEELEDVDVDDL